MNESRIITPPDVVLSENHSVLLVDPTEYELSLVASYCATHPVPYNIYLFLERMNEIEWLFDVVNHVSAIVINTETNLCSQFKDKLVKSNKAYYYGPKKYLLNSHNIMSPIDYFINHAANTLH